MKTIIHITLAVIMAFSMTQTIRAENLTIARLFAAPDLSGTAPRQVKLAPDGSRVTYLQGRADDVDHFDLWEYNIAAGKSRLLVDSNALTGGEEQLSAEEKARRERKRIAGFSGIVEYDWSPRADALLFPLGGDVYLYDLNRPTDKAVTRVTHSQGFETDARFSPQGHKLAYIRAQNLYLYDRAGGKETAITRDGGGVIKNGMAEFVAQEEMARYTGYWWSDDERYLAYTRVDESPVAKARRFEINAEGVDVIEQRYPWAGTDNVRIQLFVVDTKTGQRTEMNLGADPDIYLYRVRWFPDNTHLAVERQPRDLRTLDLLKYDIATGKGRVLLSEHSTTWIELNDDLTFLKKRPAFIWNSRRTGFAHLYLYDLDGKLIRPLTAGEWEVTGGHRGRSVAAVDEARGRLYFMANKETPLELHLYSQSLDKPKAEQPQKISDGHGVHAVDFSHDASIYVDNYSDPDQPPQMSIHKSDGERLAWLEQNAVVQGHPYFPYLGAHISPSFGTLKAEDGQDLYYRLYKPSGFDAKKHYPVLFYVYGGPQGQTVQRHWGGVVERWFQVMAQQGYLVFTVDNRGTGYRGQAFDAPIYRRLADVEVRDQLRGVEFLKQQPWVDAQRIGVFGWSYGGYMTLNLLFKAPGVFAAGVSGAPVTDWRLYDTYYTERFLDRPQDNPEGYRQSAVFPYLDKLADPLLMIHGMADDNVLFTHSTKLYKALQDANKPFDMMTYPGSKHSLARIPSTGPHAMGTITRFLERYLKPGT